MLDENTVPSTDETLETQAEVYLEAQKKLAEEAYNSSTITIVLGLMPVDDHPQGRLGILSVKNDQDVPLFGVPLRGDELTTLLEVAPVARLLTELKALLPTRVREREQKEKERQTPPPIPTTATTKAKVGQKSSPIQGQVKAENDDQPDVVASSEIDRQRTDAAADTISQPDPIPGKTTQLTLF